MYIFGGIKRNEEDNLQDLGDMYALDTETLVWRKENGQNPPSPRYFFPSKSYLISYCYIDAHTECYQWEENCTCSAEALAMTGRRNLMRSTFTIQKQRFGRFLPRYASTKLIYCYLPKSSLVLLKLIPTRLLACSDLNLLSLFSAVSSYLYGRKF